MFLAIVVLLAQDTSNAFFDSRVRFDDGGSVKLRHCENGLTAQSVNQCTHGCLRWGGLA
jgi:hypothetical protein